MTHTQHTTQRDELRITREDQAEAKEAMRAAVARWRELRVTEYGIEDVVRCGVRSIGCTIHDLREPELGWFFAWAAHAVEVER